MSSIVSFALASALRAAGIGPVSMMVGSAPESAAATMRARGVRPSSLPFASRADQDRRRAVDDARRVARRVHVVDALDLRVARQRDGVEAHRADLGERELERGEAFHRRVRLDELVPLEQRSGRSRPSTGTIERRSGRLARAAAARCCERSAKSSTSSRAKPSSVAIRSAPMPCGTKPVAMLVSGSCAQAPPSEPIGTRDMHLDAAGDDQVLPARAHLLRGQVHRLEARGAEAVQLHARQPTVPARRERRRLGDAPSPARRSARRSPSPRRRPAPVSRSCRRCSSCSTPASRVDRLDLVQAAVRLALAARRADRVENHCFVRALCHVSLRKRGSDQQFLELAPQTRQCLRSVLYGLVFSGRKIHPAGKHEMY